MKVYKNLEIEKTSFHEENIEYILADPKSENAKNYYLPEKVQDLSSDVKMCKAATSVRFLKYVDGKPVSMIQLAPRSVATRLDVNIINLAYTLPEYRNKGFASELLNFVKQKYRSKLTISNTLTDAGEKLFKPDQKKEKKVAKLSYF